MEVPVHDVVDVTIEWDKWLAVVAAFSSALWAWRSASNAAKQNEIALHNKRIEIFSAYRDAVVDYLYAPKDKFKFNKVRSNFKSQLALLEFYFENYVHESGVMIAISLKELREKYEILYAAETDVEKEIALFKMDGEFSKVQIEILELQESIELRNEIHMAFIKAEIIKHQPSINSFRLAFWIEKWKYRLEEKFRVR